MIKITDRVRDVTESIQRLGNAEIAAHSQRFFKTGKGEYGEGDRFLGIRVPVIRREVMRHRDLTPEEALALLISEYHEIRLFALLLLVDRFKSAPTTVRRTIYREYLHHTAYINNWDLVDSSAEHIVGGYLYERNRKPIYRLVQSRNLWERRIGVMATFHFIRRGDFSDTLALAELLLGDSEDLIHKAAGWMLREVGNREQEVLEEFLVLHFRQMPRTMLRYAIEKLPEELRLSYLHGTI